MDTPDLSERGTCVLCDRALGSTAGPRTGPPIGFCPACAAEMGILPVESLMQLDPAEYDRLPFGFISVDSEGRIVGFNAFERRYSGLRPEQVIGRHFFREVAPCTSVREFEGRFRELVARGDGRVARFRYVFRFRGGERLVQVSMTYVETEKRGILIVRDLDAA